MIFHSHALLFLPYAIKFQFLGMIFRSPKLIFRFNGIIFHFLTKIAVDDKSKIIVYFSNLACRLWNVAMFSVMVNHLFYYFIFSIIIISSIMIIIIVMISVINIFIWSHSGTLCYPNIFAPFLPEASCQRKEFFPIKHMFSPRSGLSGESLVGKSNRKSEQLSTLVKVAGNYCDATTQ